MLSMIAMQHKRCCNESARITEVRLSGTHFETQTNAHSTTVAIEQQREEHCRVAIVCMIGMRKFNRSATMAPIAKDVVLMIARMMWDARFDGAWVLPVEVQRKKESHTQCCGW